MSDTGSIIHQIEPREQVGARTGELYDYQYHLNYSRMHTLDVALGVV